MSTVNDLRADLQAQGYGSDTDITQLRFLDRAWARFMTHRRWSFNDTTLPVNFPSGTNSYTLPVDLRFFDSLRFTGFSDPVFLTYQRFRDHVGTKTEQGVPEFYTRRGNVILMFPTPNLIIPGFVDYNRNPVKPSLVANPALTDLGIPDVVDEILVLGAIKLMAFRQRDAESAAIAAGEYDGLLRDYMAQVGTEQRQNSQTVVRTGVHEAYETMPYLD